MLFCLSLANSQSVVTLRNSKAYSDPSLKSPVNNVNLSVLAKLSSWVKVLLSKGPELSKRKSLKKDCWDFGHCIM